MTGAEAATDRPPSAMERRHWVRLTSVCNNRCVFCLDRGVLAGGVRSRAEIEADLASGRAEGAARAVLSGGEPTLHPDLPDLIRHARSIGYRWVQIISNGRRLAYGAYLDALVAAGLDEVTFSIHGHAPEVHDALVGVPGAFEQCLRGLRSAVARGDLVVSVDIVLSRRNIDSLHRIVDLTLDLGVREYDFLWLVPFGGAYERLAADEPFFLEQRDAPQLARAIDLARSRGAVVWTNRVPARFLEGREAWIQDPSKLGDEVRGRSAEIERVVTTGVPMSCRGDRCPFCAIEGFCDMLHTAVRRARGEEPIPVVRFDPASRRQIERLRGTPWRGARALWVRMAAPLRRWPAAMRAAIRRAGDVRIEGPAAALIEARAFVGDGATLHLRPAETGETTGAAALLDWPGTLVVPWTARAVLPRPGARSRKSRARMRPEGPTGVRLRGARSGPRLVLACPTASLAERRGWGPGGGARAGASFGLRIAAAEGLPPCLVGGIPGSPEPDAFDLAWLRDDGAVDAAAIAAAFLDERNRCWSFRCERCAARSRCPGAPVALIRKTGFRILSPLAGPLPSRRRLLT